MSKQLEVRNVIHTWLSSQSIRVIINDTLTVLSLQVVIKGSSFHTMKSDSHSKSHYKIKYLKLYLIIITKHFMYVQLIISQVNNHLINVMSFVNFRKLYSVPGNLEDISYGFLHSLMRDHSCNH